MARLRWPHPELQGYANAEVQLALWLARFAYRTGDVAGLQEAAEVQARHERVGGPAHRLDQRWVAALLAGDAGTLTDLAPDYDEMLYHVYAAEVLTDAALVAMRSGNGEAELARARKAVDALGYHPLLGPLPETRWVAVAEGAA